MLYSLGMILGCSDDDKSTNGNGNGVVLADSVWVADVDVNEGEQAKVDINFSNEVQLIRVEVPVKITGTGFSIDSASFVGSRCPTEFLQLAQLDTLNKTVRLVWNGGPSLAPGSGLLASLYLSTEVGSSGEVLSIDSVTIGSGASAYYLYFINTGGTILSPGFSGGSVSIN